jgi:hypothetical protein
LAAQSEVLCAASSGICRSTNRKDRVCDPSNQFSNARQGARQLGDWCAMTCIVRISGSRIVVGRRHWALGYLIVSLVLRDLYDGLEAGTKRGPLTGRGPRSRRGDRRGGTTTYWQTPPTAHIGREYRFIAQTSTRARPLFRWDVPEDNRSD